MKRKIDVKVTLCYSFYSKEPHEDPADYEDEAYENLVYSSLAHYDMLHDKDKIKKQMRLLIHPWEED